MIIIEGVDCSGKSTLVEKLSAYYSSPVTHYTKHEPTKMLDHARNAKPSVDEIVDRFHLSEIPYSMYYRHIVPDYDTVKDIDLVVRDGNNLQIVCVPPWITVKQHWQARKEDELIKSLQALHGIYMWYKDKSQAFSSSPVWYYDYILTSFDDLCAEINEWTDENEI